MLTQRQDRRTLVVCAKEVAKMRATLILCMCCCFYRDAAAETVYLDELLSQKLAALGNFDISNECVALNMPDIKLGSFSIPGNHGIVCTIKRGHLRAVKPVTVLASNITPGNPIKSDLPSSFQAKSVVVRNCTSVDKTVRVTLNMSTTVNQQLTIAKQISTSRTDGISGGMALNFGWITGNLAGTRQWNRTTTTTETSAESQGDTVGETYAIDVVVRPKTIQAVTGKWTGSEVQIPWTATFSVDSKLAKNLAHKSKASELLDQNQRKIETSGVLRGFELGEVAISFDENNVTEQYCNDVPGNEKLQTSPEVIGKIPLQ
ncbi:hypothetical protein [Mesorhizobium sp. M0895]|uniref:hypothetical protein n=1 Tax=Mesorhizobium sp. M0895 TaxID=2957019 RepID=UPI003339DC29